VDRYMIAAYTAPGAGAYRIAGSSITHAGCQWSNGLRVNVYRNDTSVASVTVPQGGAASFNTDLGTLAAGDKIYVAAGPNTTDGCDAFTWDYAIERQSP